MGADAFFAKLGGFTTTRGGALERKRALWKMRGDKYLRQYGGMRKDALVQVDPAIQETILRMIEVAAPALAAGYNRHLIPVAEAAFDRWPVASGLSKSLLGLDFAVLPDGATFRGRVRDTAPYAWLIRWSHRTAYGSVVRALVFDPGAKAADRIAADALKELG